MQYLFDETGKAYLDAVNNVTHVRHCHPLVVKAGQDQMAALNTNSRYLDDNLTDYVERLTGLFPDPLIVCFLVCTGSEANELALRLARTHTRRNDVIVLDHAYHGNTGTLVAMSPYKCEGPGGTGLGDFAHKARLPDLYRGPFKLDDPEAGRKYAEDVELCISDAHGRGKQIAAFFSESLPSCAGQIVLPEGYLQEAFHHVRSAGGVCVSDELQVGFGRVGSHMWGFETQGVVPDMVTLGKPIGNGHPLAAVITTSEIARSFDTGMR
ncbi:MAG: aminotransferase class III-fold pyridoxal phosphate-dependent enzyme [Armatimonadetes bacterium]|nr:aminotransferase class III-fold pyridoxal phosphate-dependent enzyme [Armatimonadota bacterium]